MPHLGHVAYLDYDVIGVVATCVAKESFVDKCLKAYRAVPLNNREEETG